MQPAVEHPEIGSTIGGKYVVEAILGEGGFGVVYRATTVGTERAVAIKVLKPGATGYDETRLERFMRELRAVAQLQCPHTLTLFDYGRTDAGMPFMVTEFIEGEDLSELLARRGTLSDGEVIHILLQALYSLQEAHNLSLLHRDIKPANIRVFEYGDDALRVKLLDFGLAKSIQSDETPLTAAGRVIGTPRYMSPEQLTGAPLTPASDVYSLGLVAVEMLLGRTVTLKSGLRLKAPPIQISLSDAVDPPLRATVNRMIARSVDARFSNADEVIAALYPLKRKFIVPRTEVVKAVAAELAERADTVPDGLAETIPDGPKSVPGRPPVRQRVQRPMRTVVVLTAAPLLAIAGWWMSTQSPAPRPSQPTTTRPGTGAKLNFSQQVLDVSESYLFGKEAFDKRDWVLALRHFKEVAREPRSGEAKLMHDRRYIRRALDELIASPPNGEILQKLAEASAIFPDDEALTRRYHRVGAGISGFDQGLAVAARILETARSSTAVELSLPGAPIRDSEAYVALNKLWKDSMALKKPPNEPSRPERRRVDGGPPQAIRHKEHVETGLARTSLGSCFRSGEEPLPVRFSVAHTGHIADVKMLGPASGWKARCISRELRRTAYRPLNSRHEYTYWVVLDPEWLFRGD